MVKEDSRVSVSFAFLFFSQLDEVASVLTFADHTRNANIPFGHVGLKSAPRKDGQGWHRSLSANRKLQLVSRCPGTARKPAPDSPLSGMLVGYMSRALSTENWRRGCQSMMYPVGADEFPGLWPRSARWLAPWAQVCSAKVHSICGWEPWFAGIGRRIGHMWRALLSESRIRKCLIQQKGGF